MDSWLSFLLFAVFFYLMMRYGCGAHMVHGRHRGHEGPGAPGARKGPAAIRSAGCGLDRGRDTPNPTRAARSTSAPENAWTSLTPNHSGTCLRRESVS
jgi:hypothetical protein